MSRFVSTATRIMNEYLYSHLERGESYSFTDELMIITTKPANASRSFQIIKNGVVTRVGTIFIWGTKVSIQSVRIKEYSIHI